MTLALHTRIKVTAELRQAILKVLTLGEALTGAYPADRVAVLLSPEGPQVDRAALSSLGFAVVLDPDGAHGTDSGCLPVIHSLSQPAVVGAGDVIRVNAAVGQLTVLYRRGANANTLFPTARCNSLCLMCSQPPRDEDDGWRVDEMLEQIPLIDPDLAQLGISGGEPTLLGFRLAEVIRACTDALPRTNLHILTNGRLLANSALADSVAPALGRTTWAVPLYADIPSRHDYVVQAAGAFDATINGIYNLAERGHALEIRFVVHAQTLSRLDGFVNFIWRNMPFVRHVALMGLEPMGYARTNRDLLWADPLDYGPAVTATAQFLSDRGLNVSLYNMPLCVLPRAAWRYARQSISDWKNAYAPECAGCAVKGQCCGFFASQNTGWRSRGIHPVAVEEA